MATKVYKAFFLRSLSIDLPIGKTVVFQSGIYADSMGKYTTDNPAIQEALEKCRGFNDTFYLESVIENAPAAEETETGELVSSAEPEQEKTMVTDIKDVKRFHNIVEMRNAMAELGFEGVQEMNYLQLKSAASKEGYDFQIQK